MTIALTTVAGTIAACLAVSLCSLSGIFALWLKPETLKWLVPNLVAMAVGSAAAWWLCAAQAELYNFYCSLTVLPGAIFTLLLSQVAESSLVVLLPIAAGGFIYIAASDLIPVLHERSRLVHLGGQCIVFIEQTLLT